MLRARPVAKASVDALARATGVHGGGHVRRFLAEDAYALAAYVARPARRRAERTAAAAVVTSDECFEFSQAYFGVGPVQRRSEIAGLLSLARENGTRIACEIGAQDAGTSVMFSRALELDTLIVMDLYTKNRWRLRANAPQNQTIHVVDGDSTHPLTMSRFRRKLGARKLDLLLIDGDHRWAGVRHDFLTYREFVRDGGLIAFHDICRVRSEGSAAWAGDVPAFWELIRSIYPAHQFVEASGQEGLGIGVIAYDPLQSIASVLDSVDPP